MIQLNLLSDSIQVSKPTGAANRSSALPPLPGDTNMNLDLDLLDDEPKRKSRLPLVLGLGAAVVLGIGGAGWYSMQAEEEAPALPAPTEKSAAKPESKPVEAPKAEPAKADTQEAKSEAPKAEPTPVAKPEPKPEPKAEPVKEPVRAEAKAAPVPAGPSVKAPALSGNALSEILAQAKPASASKDKPNRFDALTPSGRTAYQKFAFERILAILRQVTPADGVGFSKVRIASPGLLSIQGTATKPDALAAFQRGLAAQSLADTSTATGKDAAFAVVARLPFNPSFGGLAVPATDVRKALQQALDLAAPQGLALKASAARTETVGGSKRTSWTLSGQGGWDGISAWLAALQSASSPIGFTDLVITAGDKGKLQVTATAVCYGP